MSDLISKNPDVMSGDACIAGTRVSVASIKAMSVHERKTPAQIVAVFLSELVTVEAVQAALEYPCEHERLNDHGDACLDCGAVYFPEGWR